MPPRPTRLANLPPELIRRIMEPTDIYAVARAQATSRSVRSALQNRLAGPATPMPGAENIRVSEPDASHVTILAHRIALLYAWTGRAIDHYFASRPEPGSSRNKSFQARYRIIADYWTETAGELRGMGRLVFGKKRVLGERIPQETTSLQEVTGVIGDDQIPSIRVEISARPGAPDLKIMYTLFIHNNGRINRRFMMFKKDGVCSIFGMFYQFWVPYSRVEWPDLLLTLDPAIPQGIGGIRDALRVVHLLKRALLVAFRQPVRITFDRPPRPFDRLFKMMGILGN